MLEVGRWMTKKYFKTLQIFLERFFILKTLKHINSQTLQPIRSYLPLSPTTPRATAFPIACCGVTATIGAMGFPFSRNFPNKFQRFQLIYQKKNIFDIIN